MNRARTSGQVAVGGGEGVVHARGHRLPIAALLLALAALPFVTASASAQSDIEFDPAITQEEFSTFSRLVAQGIYATPVDAARARGLLGFDVGVGATAIPVDTNATYWQRSTGDDFAISDHIVVPKVFGSKGLSFGTVSAIYSKVPDTDIQIWGASLDVPIMNGGIVKPTIAVRGAYAIILGVDELDMSTYGLEVFISKAFGPVTPYAAAGLARSDSTATITLPTGTRSLTDQSDSTRITIGARLSLLLPKFIVEVTQGEVRSYAAKVSLGL
jgi:hypothetical protein